MSGQSSQFTFGLHIWAQEDRWTHRRMSNDKEMISLSQLASYRGKFKIGFEKLGWPNPG